MGKLVCIFSQEIYFTDYFIEFFMNKIFTEKVNKEI